MIPFDSVREALDHLKQYNHDVPGNPEYGEAIWLLMRFVEAILPVPTEHDQEAEMDKWDEFFHEMKERRNG